MRKSLQNRLFMKQHLYSFKMVEGKSIVNQLHAFSTIIDHLENIDMIFKDEDKALLLLNAIPMSFKHFKDAVIYEIEKTISLKKVSTLLKLKDLQRQLKSQEENTGEGLIVRGRSKKKGNKKINIVLNSRIERKIRISLRRFSNASTVTNRDISGRIVYIGRTRTRKTIWNKEMMLLQLMDMTRLIH